MQQQIQAGFPIALVVLLLHGESAGWGLAYAGWTGVSGRARGIDAAAHRGALAGGGITLAVLAGGPDVAYPPSPHDLYRRILDRGAAISEHPPGSAPIGETVRPGLAGDAAGGAPSTHPPHARGRA